ncbi:hypothetical protein N9056_00810 [bacterium]|jgi:hypothetical protein|nr:hypothetical protein [bacterium]MDB4464322.1 hypothetical protein [bacterium]MDB4748901.1 hypothetical protein [Akkermansiaceae bacterium]
MKSVDFVCPQCGNSVQAPIAYRGREVACLACETLVRVPTNASARVEKKQYGPFTIVLAVVGGLTMLQLFLWLIGGSATEEDVWRSVTYKVMGSCEGASLTYNNSSGGTEQVTIAASEFPWIKTFNVKVGYFAYISAQKSGDSGNIEVAVSVDGGNVKKSVSDAAYGIADAKISVE